MHTAGYGIQVIEVIRPLNFWVGIPPTIILVIAVAMWRRFISPLSAELAAKVVGETTLRPKPRKRASELFGTVLAFVAIIPLITGYSWLVYRGFVLIGMKLSDSWFRYPGYGVLVLLALVAMIAWVAALDVLADNLHVKAKKVYYGFIVFVAACSITAAYVTWVYPLIPQEYGGGRPQRVRLVVDPQQIPLEALGWGNEQPKGDISTTISGEVSLLYKSNDAFIIYCELCTAKVVSVDKEAVKAVIWQGY